MKALSRHQEHKQIVIFLLFRLSDVETRYSNLERECLGVVQCLVEACWMIAGSPWLIYVYTNHHALMTILHKGLNNQWIQTWENWLGEYDYIVWHWPNMDSLICMANRLSQMSTQYQTEYKAEDKLGLLVAAVAVKPSTVLWYDEQVLKLSRGSDSSKRTSIQTTM